MKTDSELISLLYQTASKHQIKMEDVAFSLDVAPETVSRWKKTLKLSRSNRNQIAVWLASKGIHLEDTPPSCFLPHCPAEPPVDRFLQVILESWSQLSIQERAEIAGIVAAKIEKKNTTSKVG